MKKCLFSLLLSLAALPVAAQIEETFWHWLVIDTARIVCSYDYTEYFMFRSKHIKTHDDLWLEIGDHLSKFESYRRFQSDSLFYTTAQAKEEYSRRVHEAMKVKGKNKDESFTMMMEIMPNGSDQIIYKNYPQDSLMVQDWIKNRLYYTELLEPQAWEIRPDTTMILGYKCQMAECDWRGRHYVAWFTEEIPISDGPYKFNGLPGLIFSVKDSTDEYSWEIRSIVKPNGSRIYLSEPLNGDHYKRNDRIKTLKTEWRARLGHVKKANSDDIMLGCEPGETEDPYDLIELDYK